jgi:uncharacterized integral membrane protein
MPSATSCFLVHTVEDKSHYFLSYWIIILIVILIVIIIVIIIIITAVTDVTFDPYVLKYHVLSS